MLQFCCDLSYTFQRSKHKDVEKTRTSHNDCNSKEICNKYLFRGMLHFWTSSCVIFVARQVSQKFGLVFGLHIDSARSLRVHQYFHQTYSKFAKLRLKIILSKFIMIYKFILCKIFYSGKMKSVDN